MSFTNESIHKTEYIHGNTVQLNTFFVDKSIQGRKEDHAA